MNVFTTGMNGQGGGTTSPSTQTTRGFLKASREVPAQTQAARPRQASASNMWTITTTTGKQYSIDNKQFNWIKNRYQQQMADTYGFDDADQLAKRNGQLSASALKTYKNSNVDRKLAELGLPSEKNLEKYLESYNQWHTGGMDQVFGQMNLPKNYWTNVKGWYQSDMQNAYENTAEDQQRKARGLMPSKWEAKYTDTEIDDQLRARGLPPISEFNTYRDRWNNYTGIENFYANVALKETNLRLAGITDDSTEQSYGGKKQTGHDFYVDAFYDELELKNDDGSYVYAPIRAMFKNGSKPSGATPTGDYAYDRGTDILAANKDEVSDEDYANYTAFSYDDYKKHYDDLYQRYFANQKTQDGQLVSDALAVLAREEDAEATRSFYDPKEGEELAFIQQWRKENPKGTAEDMFADMLSNGASIQTARRVMKTARAPENSESIYGGKNKRDDGWGWSDIGKGFVNAKTGNTPKMREEEAENRKDARYDVEAGNRANATFDASREKADNKIETVQNLASAYDAAYKAGDKDALYSITQKLRALDIANREAADTWLKENADLYSLDNAIEKAKSYMDSNGKWTLENKEAALLQLRRDGFDADTVNAASEHLQLHYGPASNAADDEKAKLSTPEQVSSWMLDYAQTHGDTQRGEWTEEKANEMFKTLDKQGVPANVVMGVIEDEASFAQLAEYADQYYTGKKTSERINAEVQDGIKSANEFIDATLKEQGEDEATIDSTKNAIRNTLAAIIDENDSVDVDTVLSVLDQVSKLSSTNYTAMKNALEDLGFSYGVQDDLAGDITAGWSDEDLKKLQYGLFDYMSGIDMKEPEANDKGGYITEKVADTLGDEWVGDHFVQNKALDTERFEAAVEWAQQEIASGRRTEWEAYQVLAAMGLQNEMQTYMGDDWHRAHYIENVLPGLWATAEESERLLYEEMTPEERRNKDIEIWNALPADKKAAIYDSPYWWEADPSVYRTFGQSFKQQMKMVLPGLATEIVSTPVKILDAVTANISGRPEMWDSTRWLMGLQEGIAQYGSVTDNVNGAGIASAAADVVQELGRMYWYGNIGGAIGGAFAGTKTGAAVLAGSASNSAVVKGASKMFMSMVSSSPFVASAFANNYAEVKELGAPNNEATWFALITGLSEGILEGFEFDELWGKALGQGNFAKQLALGKHTYMQNLGIVGKAWISSMAVSGLGEFTEESIGYVLETFLKMRHSDTWGKGTEWSASDWLQQAMMGFITGALGGGIAAGSSFVKDGVALSKALRDNPSLQAILPDVLAYNGEAETMPKATLDAYRKGGATALSRSAYNQLITEIENNNKGIENYTNTIEAIEAKRQKAIGDAQLEVDKIAAKIAPYSTPDASGNIPVLPAEVYDKEFAPLLVKYKAAIDHLDYVTKNEDPEAAKQLKEAKSKLQNALTQKESLAKQEQEHWAALYLMNEHLHDILSDEMLDNLAKAYQNGAQYDPEEAAKQREEKASKLAEAEANETMAEAEEAAKTPEDAATKARELAYDRVYKDQEAGKAYAEERRGEGDSNMTRVQFAENERQNFQAKTTARLRRVTLELAGLEAKEGMSAKEIFEEAKKAMTPEAAQKLDMYQKLSKALGLNMVVRDVVAGTSGYVHDGKLYVTLNGKQSMLRVASHELTHYMKDHAKAQYDALRTSLVNEVGQEKFDEMLADKAKEYGLDLNDAKARLEADDEVCAELCEKMLENPDALERFVQSDLDAAKTLKQRLGKTLVAIKSAIRTLNISTDTKNDLIKEQETIEKWYKGLSDAIDAANNSAKAKAKPVTETVADTTTKAAPKETRIIDPWTGEEINLWSKSYKDWGYEGSSNSNYAVYLALKQVNPEMAKAYEDAGNGGSTDVLDAVINIANDVRQEQISPMAAATLLSNQYNADKTSLGSLFIQDSRNATQEAFQAAQEIDAQHEASKGANADLFMGEESARREQLRTDLEALAKKGTKVQDVSRQEVNDVLDRVILGDKSNYNKADYAQIRGMLAQLIPEVTAYVNGDATVDANVLNERLSAAIDYMLERYGEGSEDYYNLRDLIPSKIALTDTAYKDLRAKDMTLRQASNELTKALGGKFVNFVYKRSPDYGNAMTIDELWQTITDQYGEQNGVGNIGEDALALIDYVRERADNRTSFNDLYGSQREDMVNTQVGEFLDAVQSLVEGKSARKAALYKIDDDYMPLAERYDAGIATDADVEEMRRDVDEAARDNGYTIKAYHGTTEDFTEFNRGTQGQNHDGYLEFGGGFYFTPDAGEAREWVSRGRSGMSGEATPRVMAVYLNPGRILGADDVVPGGADYLRSMWLPAADANFIANRAYRFINYLTEERGFSNTEVQDTLKALGFDAIDATFGHGKSGQYVVFDPEQIKSADPVTYDDNGDIIPLSERFDPSKTDIRWTVDDDLADLVEQYGAIEQGREPRARDVQVPKQVDDKTRVSKLARSAAESPIMSDEHAEKILNDIEADKDRIKKVWSYIPKSNDEMAQKAREFIADKQPASAQREFHDMVVSGNTSLLTEAVGLQLLADAAMRDDWVSVDELLFDLRVLATDAGQRSQIFNTLKELKGIGSAWYLEKLVAKLNTQYADAIRTGEIDGPITVSDAAMQQVRAAKTQAEVDAAEAVVAKELAVQLPLTWDEKLSNWRFLSMLGNPITHVRNFTGNKLMYGMGGIKDVVASGIQRLLEGTSITDASDRAHALLTPADWKYWDSFVQKSYEEQRSNLQGGGKLGFQSLLQQNKRSFDNKVLDTIARGKNPGVMSEKGRAAGLFENIKNNGAMGMLEVADAWGLEDNYKRSLTEYMKAQGYELRNGVVGKVGKDGSFTEISTEAMNKAIEWASSQAWTNTFRGPSEFATALNKISKINPVMKLFVEGVMPFKKTPINIAKQGFWYSPAGAIVGTVELLTKVKQGKMSAATAIDHLSSGLTGTALMALGVVLAKAGILRGGGEDKKKLETYLEDTGDQTYAFKFGNVSINMSAIAPATIPLFMGVALQEMLSRNGEDEGVDLSTITDVLAGTLNPFMEMSFMSSLNSALKNYNNEGIGGALGSTIMTAAQNYGSQYLPTLGGKVAQFIDPTQRTTKSSATSPVGGNMDYYWRSLVKKVPGAEATLQPDVNIWGQTTTKDSFGDWALDFANKFILPTNVKVTNRDSVDNELIRVVESTGIADFLPSDGAKYFKVKGETYKMNASQYTEYSKDRGQAAYAALKDVMAGASYKTATDEQKAELLKKALDNAYKQVNNVWKEKLGAYDK